MAHITSIILYEETDYLHSDDADIQRGFSHGYSVNTEHAIALLRLCGADELAEPCAARLALWTDAG
jgi:hypothetical protein